MTTRQYVKLFFATVFVLCMLLAILPGCSPQSRTMSRWTGKDLKLKLPANYAKPVSFATGRDGEKDLTYIGTDEKLHVKSYTDSGRWESSITFEQ